MKERFKQVELHIDGTLNFSYIKEQKKHWWSKWDIVMDGDKPLYFHTLPEGVQAVNEAPRHKIDRDCSPWLYPIKPSPLPPTPAQLWKPIIPTSFPKGDADIRSSMVDMIRNADEIYVGIKQDGVFYLAYEACSLESLHDLMDLKEDDDNEDE